MVEEGRELRIGGRRLKRANDANVDMRAGHPNQVSASVRMCHMPSHTMQYTGKGARDKMGGGRVS